MHAIAALMVAATTTIGLPAEAMAQGSGEAVEPYAVCVASGGLTRCEVVREIPLEDLKLTAPEDDPGALSFPDEQDPGRLVCAEGQASCIVVDEQTDLSLEDLEAALPGAENLVVFTAGTDASPIGRWSLTTPDTVIECSTTSQEVPGSTATVLITDLGDGRFSWSYPDVPGASVNDLVRIGRGTYGMRNTAQLGGDDWTYIAMQDDSTFVGGFLLRADLLSGTDCEMQSIMDATRLD